MTRTVPAALQSHLDGATTSTATLWRITREDGVTFHFTDHDADIVFGGNTYVASVGYQRAVMALCGGSAERALTVEDLQRFLATQ